MMFKNYTFSFSEIKRKFIGFQPFQQKFHVNVEVLLDSTQYKEVSSAKMYGKQNQRELGRSFIYIKNNSGPKTEPWGTPCFTSSLVEEFKIEILITIIPHPV